jgi:hypothetical protein
MNLLTLLAFLSEQMQVIAELVKGSEAEFLSLLSGRSETGDRSRLQDLDLALQILNDCKSVLVTVLQSISEEIHVDVSKLVECVRLEKLKAEIGHSLMNAQQSSQGDKSGKDIELFL